MTTKTHEITGEVLYPSRVQLDWLQWTLPAYSAPSYVLPDHELFDVVAACRPIKNYDLGWRLGCGAVVSVSEKRPLHMGVNVVMTGDNLEAVRGEFTDDEILKWAQEKARKISRCDVALDVEYEVDFENIQKHVVWGLLRTRMGMDSYYRNLATGGESIYFGATKSDRRVVIYNKAAEMGLLEQALTRVEMRGRNRTAALMVAQMRQDGVSKGARIQMKSYFDYDADWYQTAVGDVEDSELVKAEPKPDKWEHWILNVVIPSLEKSADDPKRKPTIQYLKEQLKNV